MPAEKLCVVGGGARSGKSRFALKLAMGRGQRRLFIATAEAYDEEMRARIQAHQAERTGFDTLDAPENLEQALDRAAGYDIVLIDCLTLYLSNALLRAQAERAPATPRQSESASLFEACAAVEAELPRLLHRLAAVPTPVIVVTNEVGQGIVPENALARAFRDLAGRANQLFATQADELYLAFFGQPLRIKPPPVALHGE